MKAPALGGVLLLAGLGAGLVSVPPRLSIESKSQASGAAVRIEEAYGRLPLSFEPNQGQTDARVRFVSHGPGYALFLTGDGAVLSLHAGGPQRRPRTAGPGLFASGPWAEPGPARPAVTLSLRLVNANPGAQLEPLDELPGKSNYFLGNDPSQWRTNVPNYARVRYRQVYPGIDLVYYGNPAKARQDPAKAGQLEYDFVVAAGADPKAIRLAVEGADATEVSAEGDLVLRAGGEEARFRRPVVYQETAGRRREIAGRFVLATPQPAAARPWSAPRPGEVVARNLSRQSRDPHSAELGFEVGAYDPSLPLVIDPTLAYSTYLGGSGEDFGSGIAVDAAGNAYVTGYTGSTNFPTANPLQGANRGAPEVSDVFVAKLNAAGSALVYSTYLGGSSYDYGSGIAVDAAGNAYVTGYTSSTNFPTANPLQATNAGGYYDAFVAKLSAAGSALVYSTYLGGSARDYGNGIAVDAAGNAYVTGSTYSTDFPMANPFQTSRGDFDAFVAKLNAAGSALVYSTYLGGSNSDYGNGIAVDAAGNAYVTGQTYSTNFPTANPLQATNALRGDVFVAKLSANGSALVYSTYLGGSGTDYGYGIAVDSAGNAYVTGLTTSTNFPTANSFQASNAGGTDVFVAKLNAAGSALVYSTYLGGSSSDFGYGIAVDAAGNAYVTGQTYSTNFPTANPLQATNAGNGDEVFVAKVNPAGSALVYSTYLGGSRSDCGDGIAVDSAGNAYVTGTTSSTNFPIANAFQSSNPGGYDDPFIAKLSSNPVPTLTSLSPSSAIAGGAGFTLTVNGSNFVPGSVVRWNGSNRATTFVSSTQLTAAIPNSDIAAAGSASVTVFNPSPDGGTSTALNFNITGTGPTPQAPSNGVLNGAGFDSSAAALSPGMIASVFGTNLTTAPASGLLPGFVPGTDTLNTIAAGTRVTFDGVPAPLFFLRHDPATFDQLNIQVPFELAGKASAQMVVTVNGVASAPVTVPLLPSAAGLFTVCACGKNAAVVQNQNFSTNSASNPAPKGSVVLLYATGLGATQPAGITGKAAPSAEPLARSVEIPTVTIGGAAANVEFSGLAPFFVGLWQVNVRIPDAAGSREVELILRHGGQAANKVTLFVQ
jgi:uncharacterized protein (TIGR03437 family)